MWLWCWSLYVKAKLGIETTAAVLSAQPGESPSLPPNVLCGGANEATCISKREREHYKES